MTNLSLCCLMFKLPWEFCLLLASYDVLQAELRKSSFFREIQKTFILWQGRWQNHKGQIYFVCFFPGFNRCFQSKIYHTVQIFKKFSMKMTHPNSFNFCLYTHYRCIIGHYKQNLLISILKYCSRCQIQVKNVKFKHFMPNFWPNLLLLNLDVDRFL